MADRERRLTTIVAIDVAGYSRLMHADETGTLDRLNQARAISDPIGRAHGGRIVGTTGDGVLAEFPSVVEAVAFALRTQAAMAELNVGIADDEKMLYRIGINLGDVLVEGGDLFGDGVNVAARLEALAEPGGICISRTARDQVRDRIDAAFADLGDVAVKNIARPVRAFRVTATPEAIAALTPAATPVRPGATRRPVVAAIAAGVALTLIAVSAAAWWWLQRPDLEPADPAKFAYALPAKPSIAVLPFDNLSGDPAQDYIGDGLTESIISVLATSPDLFIIARNSSFAYKGKTADARAVSEQLGVRYVLRGSVQRSGDRLRLTAQLVDAVDGRHLWAERYDRALADLFAVQDDITDRILQEMQVTLTFGEQVRDWRELAADLEAYRLSVQGRARWLTFSPEGHRDAERLWRQLLERQPDSLLANMFMGWLHFQKVTIGLSKDPVTDLTAAKAYAEKALSISEDGSALVLHASVDVLSGDYAAAIANADRAVALDPSDGDVLAIAGWAKAYSGQPREGVELLQRGMRLQPFHAAWMPSALAFSHLMLGQHDEARKLLRTLADSPTPDQLARRNAIRSLAVLSVFEGDLAAARKHIEALRQIWPDANLAEEFTSRHYLSDRAFVARYLDALRQAGLPEKPPSATAE